MKPHFVSGPFGSSVFNKTFQLYCIFFHKSTTTQKYWLKRFEYGSFLLSSQWSIVVVFYCMKFPTKYTTLNTLFLDYIVFFWQIICCMVEPLKHMHRSPIQRQQRGQLNSMQLILNTEGFPSLIWKDRITNIDIIVFKLYTHLSSCSELFIRLSSDHSRLSLSLSFSQDTWINESGLCWRVHFFL